MTSAADDSAVQGVNITCGAEIDIAPVSSMIAVSRISPQTNTTDANATSRSSVETWPRHSKSLLQYTTCSMCLQSETKPWVKVDGSRLCGVTPLVFCRVSITKNSSGDEIANVNFRYDDIVYTRTTKYNRLVQKIPPQIDAVMC